MTAMSRHDLVHALEDFLTSLIPLQAHAVVVIDEAQHIEPDVLEQIRLLSNIDDERGTMLQIILVGQADLEAILSRPELRQFQQRVSRRFRLEPLSADELRLYVEHRLAVGRGGGTRSQMSGAKELERALAEWDGTRRPSRSRPTRFRPCGPVRAGSRASSTSSATARWKPRARGARASSTPR